MQRARTNISEKHGKQNEKGEAQKKKDENDGRVTRGKQNNVEE